MDKVINFFKNKWCKRFFALFSPLFPLFIGYVDWLAFAYSMEPLNPIALFLLYVLVNFVLGGLMFYTRNQILTRFCLCISPLLIFLMMIIDFGNWYMLIPPLVICAFVFLASGAGETLKTVLGTIYLLMFVVGALVYLTLLHFNLTPQSLLLKDYCDLDNRTYSYVYSPDSTYRLVTYIDDDNPERVSASFYVEECENDVQLPFLNAYRHFDSLRVLVTVHLDELEYHWITDEELFIDGRTKNIPELFIKQRTPEEEEEETSESGVKKPIIFDEEEEAETTSAPEDTAVTE
ncbi:MAG: hypothetical protein IJ416_03995 [Ruminiclostridium sp.]|nr:hypothetical protein [Ruminiclostridium sp.]